MKIAMFSTRSYDINHFDPLLNAENIEFEYFDTQLNLHTVQLAQGFDAVCAFVNDDLSKPVLNKLDELGVKIVAMRCAGFNNVDIYAAKEQGITVVRVPAYSPEAVAEHSIALIMSLNRRIHKAYLRTRDANFSLEGLVGFNLFGKTVGVIGTGKIGVATMAILKGFGCKILAYDPYPSEHALKLGAEYVELEELYAQSDIISLHCPLTADNHHLLNSEAFAQMKDGVILANSGHFNNEINIPVLEKQAKQKRRLRQFVDDYELTDGRHIFLLGEGRLVNLAAAEGHPASVMDMSFANQALCSEYMVKLKEPLKPALHPVPVDIDNEVARLKLQAMGVDIDTLTDEQRKYLASWESGT